MMFLRELCTILGASVHSKNDTIVRVRSKTL